jgi:hypothetical protein
VKSFLIGYHIQITSVQKEFFTQFMYGLTLIFQKQHWKPKWSKSIEILLKRQAFFFSFFILWVTFLKWSWDDDLKVPCPKEYLWSLVNFRWKVEEMETFFSTLKTVF